MEQSVVIKSAVHGLNVVLSPELSFEELLSCVAVKFKESAKFLGNAQMAISFQGRTLSSEEELRLLQIISEHSELQIACIIDSSPEFDAVYQNALDEKLEAVSKTTGQFYKGNLRSGQVLEKESSIILIGEVNAGASIISQGNIIILGGLRGIAFAGAGGNENTFVMALDMQPMQIRIADVIARAPDHPVKQETKEAKIAFLDEGNIYIEPISRKILSEIHF